MKKIIGAAIGTCVHVGGLYHFLKLAEAEGFHISLLGPAVSIDRIVEMIHREKPEVVALSYRLTPEVAEVLFHELASLLTPDDLRRTKLIFGGTPKVAIIAKNFALFDHVFDGSESVDEIKAYLSGTEEEAGEHRFAQDLLSRIKHRHPYPIIRHHFGRPTLEETIKGIRQIALSGVVDVISIGPDQNAQENFFRPQEMDKSQAGAGGVPVRKPEDMTALYEASRCGNYPLMRCYAGTRDLQKWAEMSVATIHNAWAAIPLTWYSILDGRSNRTPEEAITENQKVVRWYAQQEIPVEVNEAHQWSLRDAHDALAVAMAYLAAYNAKKMGVRHYVSQFMFNTPPGTTPAMDLAKMAAKLELISELEDDAFSVIREVRAGIAHFSPVPNYAKGQLAASALISLALKPHILHVVGYSEGDHLTSSDELIESCEIVHGVIRDSLEGLPDMFSGREVTIRKNELITEARVLLEGIRSLGDEVEDPLTEPHVIARALLEGVLDTPHFKGNPFLRGDVTTGIIRGAWYALNPVNGSIVDEESRVQQILHRIKNH